MVDKFGLMVQFMKECGVKIWLMVKEDSYTQEEMFMRDNG